jgi:hypothetical protein
MPGQLFLRGGALFDKYLHERAGFGRVFPRRGALASRQLDDHIANAPRFAAFQHDILGDVVALVEQAQRGHPVAHRRAKCAFDHRALARRNRPIGLRYFGWRRGGRIALLAAPGQRGRNEAARENASPNPRWLCGAAHQSSGDQAS